MEKYGESRGVILTRYRKFLDRKRIRKKLKGSDYIFEIYNISTHSDFFVIFSSQMIPKEVLWWTWQWLWGGSNSDVDVWSGQTFPKTFSFHIWQNMDRILRIIVNFMNALKIFSKYFVSLIVMLIQIQVSGLNHNSRKPLGSPYG